MYISKLKQSLIDEVIKEQKDLVESTGGDWTVLEELLSFVPNENLLQALSEDKWNNFDLNKIYP